MRERPIHPDALRDADIIIKKNRLEEIAKIIELHSKSHSGDEHIAWLESPEFMELEKEIIRLSDEIRDLENPSGGIIDLGETEH